MKSFLGVSALAASALAASASPQGARAAVITPARSLSAVINPGAAPLFADASLALTDTQTVAAGSSGEKTITFASTPDLTSYSYASTGGVSVTETSVVTMAYGPYGDTIEVHTIDVDATGAGSWTVVENAGVHRYGASAAALTRGPSGARPGYEFVFLALPVMGLVDAGGDFAASVSIPGDYAPAALSRLYGINTDWTVSRPAFAYDPATNLTTLSADDPHYNGTDFLSLGVDFYAPIPEPAGAPVLLLGACALAAAGAARAGRRASRCDVPPEIGTEAAPCSS